ncbi:MAG: ABC transporter substrate-binding protein [Flavobacterium sp.]|nr:ABC transporter substrate-binding protein [Flavobacterium sp.]
MRIKLSIALFFSISFLFAQNDLLWKGYFSYNEIVDVVNGEDKIYAATENCVIFKNLILGDVNQINSITGFKPESITTLYHSTIYDKTLAGNTNGLLLIVNKNGSISQKVDIIEEVPVPPNKKRINHFYEHDGKIFIATNYGISVLDLQTSEFIVTYFIGPLGEEVEVLQTTVLNNEIYAVTRNNGIRKASLSNPFLYDFNQWQTFDAGNWSAIVTFNNELIVQDANTTLYRNNGTSFIPILNTLQNALKLKTNNTQIILTTQNNVFVLDQNYTVIAQITQIPNFDVTFSAATVINDNLYVGTTKNGLFSATLSNLSVFENITPNGPEKNYIFRIKKAPNKLWAVYGRYTLPYEPIIQNDGISSYQNDTGWKTIPYTSLLDAKCFTGIAISPKNNNEVYFSSYNNGLLKLDSNGDFTLFDHTNTGNNGLEQIPANPTTNIYNMPIRTNSPEFDKEGNLWLTSAWVTKGLKVLRANGQWQSYDFDGILEQAPVSRFAPIKIDKNGTKWLPTRNDGVLAFNDKLNNKAIVIDNLSGLPSTIVQCIEIDNRNQLWIGTAQGLRVLSSVDRFISENELSTTSIIIQEGDLAQELFFSRLL